MTKNSIKEGILKALENIFIFIDPDELDNINLDEYILDSLQFMSFIVELEDIFKIEFPPELLLIENFNNIEDISTFIEELVKLQS